MPGRRRFDLGLLRRLIEDHPDWSHYRLALELTNHNSMRGEPFQVTPSAVAQAIRRNKARWAADGFIMERRSLGRSAWIDALKQLRGFRYLPPNELSNSQVLKRLRQAERLSVGLDINPSDELPRVRQWIAERRQELSVVDLDRNGRAIIRYAQPWEIDGTGALIALHALPMPEDFAGAFRPRTDDPTEVAIWHSSELSQLDRIKLIREYRKASGHPDTPGEQGFRHYSNGRG